MSEANQQNMKETIPEPELDERVLNPIDRVSEIIFGIIMALTFTCSLSVIETDRTEVKELLLGALTCNIAWGLVDAVIFLIMTMIEKGRDLSVYNFIRKSKNTDRSNKMISESLPPAIASVMKPEEIENIRLKLLKLPESPAVMRLKLSDYKASLGIFILVFLSTFPVTIPFLLISDLQLALRTSNLTAILIMFLGGYMLGKYSGRNRYVIGFMMSVIGIVLVIATILLGG